MQSIMAKIWPCTAKKSDEKQHISFGKSIKQQRKSFLKKRCVTPAYEKACRLFKKHSPGWRTPYSLQPTSTEHYIAVRPIVTSNIIDTSKSSLRQSRVGDGITQKGDELPGGGEGVGCPAHFSVCLTRPWWNKTTEPFPIQNLIEKIKSPIKSTAIRIGRFSFFSKSPGSYLLTWPSKSALDKVCWSILKTDTVYSKILQFTARYPDDESVVYR